MISAGRSVMVLIALLIVALNDVGFTKTSVFVQMNTHTQIAHVISKIEGWVKNGVEGLKSCHECGKTVWPLQRKVKSNDKFQVAHRKCRPEGFHDVDATIERELAETNYNGKNRVCFAKNRISKTLLKSLV